MSKKREKKNKQILSDVIFGKIFTPKFLYKSDPRKILMFYAEQSYRLM